MNKSKVENGEVIEEFRKKFPYLSVHRYTTTDFNSSMSTSQCNEEVEAFITNALNQQRELLVEQIIEKAQWCPFCGDGLDCFGCQVMEDRTMTKRIELLKKEFLTKVLPIPNEGEQKKDK